MPIYTATFPLDFWEHYFSRGGHGPPVPLSESPLCLTNTLKLSESKYQAGFGVIILGQNPLTFMIPIYSTTVLYYI